MDANAEVTSGSAAISLDPRLHGVLANPLRWEIVMRTGARPWCATELAEVTGYRRRHVSKAIKELEREGFVELVETKPGPKGRGAANYYRAIYRFIIETPDLDQLSASERALATRNLVASICSDMVDSLDANLLHAHPHHVMMRDHRRLDDEGMKKVEEIFRRAYDEAVEEEAASLSRCEQTEEEPFWVVYGLSSFQKGPERPAS